jgi:hypothetical protein
MISLKSKMGIAIVAVCGAGIVALATGLWLPSMMKPSSRAERFDTISRQELRNLYQHLDTYREAHAGKLPADLNELEKATGYFTGLTQDARNKRISALEYPISGSTSTGKRVIAAYQISGGPRLLLLDSGEVVGEQ